jgi:plastocyanin
MMFCKRVSSAALLLAMAFMISACDGSSGAGSLDPGPTGAIRGRVRLAGDPPKPATDAITQDQSTCGTSVSLPRIVLGKDNGVADTFLILEGVPAAGRPRPAPVRQALLVDQKACQYVPHTMIVPLGSNLEITNSDTILHNVNGKQNGEARFNYAQAVKGQRQSVDMAMVKPGILSLSCEAGHPWMSAHIYVASDPYVALTNSDGEFEIKGVPPGTYTLKMWHEGVTVKQIHKRLQLYEYEAPYEASQQVTVTENGEATVDFELELRKE